MATPSPREKQLMRFLASVPPEIALKLHDTCDQARIAGDKSLPHDLICAALKPKADEARDLSNHPLFGGAASLVTEDDTAPEPGAILKSSLGPFERFAKSVSGEIVSDLQTGARSRIAGRCVLGAALREVFNTRMNDENDQQEFIKSFGSERGTADARKIITLLCAEPELSENLFDLPDEISDIDEDKLAAIRNCHAAIIAKAADAELLLMFILMTRLKHRWMILRVAKAISNKQDDLLFSRTDFSVIGELLLDEAAASVEKLRLDARQPVNADQLIASLDDFAAITLGMTRELGIRKDGEWGKRLHRIRHDAASHMEDICRATPDAIEKALPVQRVKLDGNIPATRPVAHDDPKLDKAERAVALCDVLHRCRNQANAGSFASVRVRMFEEASKRLDDYGACLIDLIHDSGAAQTQKLAPWVELTGRAIKALMGDDAFAVFQRRASVAAAKSSQDAA